MTAALRLASFNLLSGRSLRDGQADAQRLATAVASLGADVLALQEVDRHQERTGRADQAAAVAAAIGAAEHRFVALVHGTPGEPGWRPAPAARGPEPDDPAEGPTYGIALVSRRPVLSWHVLHLDPPRGRYPIPLPTRPPRLLWIPDEPRAVLAAVLIDPRMTVACTHLSFVPGVNALQLRRVKRWLERLPGPHVLLGDLNLPAGVPARLTGWTPLVSAATFPAPAPRVQLDHALAAGLASGTLTQGRAIELDLSDHRAIVVDLEPARAGSVLP